MERFRFVEIGRSADPPGVRSNIGSAHDPCVVALCVTAQHPMVLITVGSGHLGSGGVLAVHDVITSDGELQEHWVGDLERADALWVLPWLRALLAGETVTEADLVTAHRHLRGVDPSVDELAVARPV